MDKNDIISEKNQQNSTYNYYKTYPIKDKCEGHMNFMSDFGDFNQNDQVKVADLDLTIVLYGKGPYYRQPYNDILKYSKFLNLGGADKEKYNFNKLIIGGCLGVFFFLTKDFLLNYLRTFD